MGILDDLAEFGIFGRICSQARGGKTGSARVFERVKQDKTKWAEPVNVKQANLQTK